MTTEQTLGGSLLLVCGLGILVMGFGILKARRPHEVFATLILGVGSMATAVYVFAN